MIESAKHPARAAAKRPWRHFALMLVLGVLVLGALFAVEWDLTGLTDPARREFALDRMLGLLAAFAHPETDSEFLARAFHLTLETMAVAAIGTFVAACAAYLIALGASRAVMVGEENLTGWRRYNPLRRPAALVCSCCRLLLDVFRAIPDFAWAILLVPVLGLGPVTGALALAISVTGILGKLYSELWDSVDERRYEQVRALGVGRLKTFFYGIRPLASRSVQSFTLMRVECAVRNAAVIGAVGGGGLGADLLYHLKMGAWGKVTTLILFTLALTLAVDLGSNLIRRQLRNDPNHPRAIRASGSLFSLTRGYVGVGFAVLVTVWAVWYMGWGNAAEIDGGARNYLAPLSELFTGQAWARLGFFRDLLSPDLSPAFVARVAESALVPLSIALVGTLVGIAGAIVLTYPHSLAFQLESSQFSGESPSMVVRTLRILQLVFARTIGLVSRGVPEIMWAFIFIAFFGFGLLPGAIAIGLHTMGVLVRVFSETVDNVPYRRYEQAFMGSRLTCFGCVAAPISWRDWMTYSFFQFESNVRTGVVLGIVGVGGLGFYFTFNFEWFRFEKAATYMLMMVVITIVIDRTSRILKLNRVSR